MAGGKRGCQLRPGQFGGGRWNRGQEIDKKEVAGNLEHMLHPSVTNVEMVSKLKLS